jgi:hypothetical protein
MLGPSRGAVPGGLQVSSANPADLLHAIDLQPQLAALPAQQDHPRRSALRQRILTPLKTGFTTRFDTEEAPQIEHRPNLATHIDDSRKHLRRPRNRRGANLRQDLGHVRIRPSFEKQARFTSSDVERKADGRNLPSAAWARKIRFISVA